MTDLTDQQIEALDAAATPGPWSLDALMIAHNFEREDAKFASAARSLVPSLLARAQEAEAERDALRAQVVELLCPRCMSGPKGACGCYADGPSVGDQLGAEVLRLGIERDALAARLASAEAKLAKVEKVCVQVEADDREHRDRFGEHLFGSVVYIAEMVREALAADTTPEPTEAKWTRDPKCIAQWPDCRDGEYNPACCRFPKACSCDVPAIPEQEAGNE